MKLGLDLGSTAIKRVQLDDNGHIVHHDMQSAHKLHDVLDAVSDGAVYATGYFRTFLKDRAKTITEISAAIAGTSRSFDDVGVIIDIGGQDVKVIDVKKDSFRLNDTCSAGTGAFLEFMAQYLGLDMDELSALGTCTGTPPQINSTCSVFALSEVISQLAHGYTVNEIVAGINAAFAKRIAQLVPAEYDGSTVVIGGPAKNTGMIRALAVALDTEILIPDEPQLINAVGSIAYWEDG